MLAAGWANILIKSNIIVRKSELSNNAAAACVGASPCDRLAPSGMLPMTSFSFERAVGVLLLVLTVILSLMMVHSPGTVDVSTFLNWTEVVYQNGNCSPRLLRQNQVAFPD